MQLKIEPLEDRRLMAVDLSSLTFDESNYRADSLIVQFRAGASSPGSLAAHQVTGQVGDEWEIAPDMRRVELDVATDWAAALAAYQSDPNVVFAQPDHRVRIQVVPNDPRLDQLYGLDNSGQNNGLEDADIDAPEAWDVTKGSHDTIVAVIDTGVDYNHPDLKDNIWTNQLEFDGDPGRDDDGNGFIDDIHGYDFVNRDGDPMDDHFHGTHVAGTIGAVGNNGIGITGVAWNVQIMALKFLDESGGGYESDAVSALNYAVANGAVISNNSWGGGGFSQAFENALKNAATKGHLFVAAAGNDGWNNDLDPVYPASYKVDNVIAVAATDRNDELAWFSNYGVKSVDLAAPGVDIYSTFPTQETDAMQAGGYSENYETISGTSMATPHVSGVAALLLSANSGWDFQQVIDAMRDNVDVIDAAAKTISGGRVNAAAALGSGGPDISGPRVVGSDPATVTGAVNFVRLRFSEPIDASTVGIDDVNSFTGPDGSPIDVISVAPVAGNTRQIDVTFATQTAVGSYSLSFGPNVSDLAGNLMDQDRNGFGGEETSDRYSATFEISDVIEFDSDELFYRIEMFTPATTDTISIDEDITIGDLNVRVDLYYPYAGDLKINLISPQGKQVSLSRNNGGHWEGDDWGNGYVEANTYFDDEASTPISAGQSQYFVGTYRPNGKLSTLDGLNARGDWKLRIVADPNFDYILDPGGYLFSWSLQLSGGSGTPPTDPPDDPPPPPPPGNRAPVAVNDQLEGEFNTTLGIPFDQLLGNDSDPDGDALAITAFGIPTGGSVTIEQGLVTFTPTPDFLGQASFTYTVTDGALTDQATVTIAILTPTFNWHNAAIPEDVNKDLMVTAKDALAVINQINAFGITELVFLLDFGSVPEQYLDVAADNRVTPKDALDIINYINAGFPTQPTVASGEGAGLAAAANAGSGDAAAASSHDAAILSLMASEGVGAGPGGKRARGAR